MLEAFEAFSHFFDSHDAMLTILGGAMGGLFALWKYRADQHWTKQQFAYDYAQRVLDDPKAMTALRMLDWANGEIPPAVATEFGLARAERAWNQEQVAEALRVHDQDPGKPEGELYTPLEHAIRELFDVCLAHFERLGHFVRNGDLSLADFPTTLAYYAQVIREDRLQPVRRPLERYMARYGFDHAFDLFERLGKGLEPRGV